ncbi:acyltransferase family protein [Streptomyces sp. SPB074]|uniref:acyltransferase family protein n=1 Tax=Streptomyces sp. (strain SPB074) TaxID=465543 RepID=UPI00017FEB01|nr:acyltransferase [Streptomyces sp. SPB074]EDY44147.1 acyltransferase [Streptomyces sp. SPB074]
MAAPRRHPGPQETATMKSAAPGRAAPAPTADDPAAGPAPAPVPGAPAPGPPPARAKARDPWFDNTRFVAATLIVVLHTIGSIMSRHEALHAFNVAAWAFRVPAFVVLAGVFSSASPLDSRRLRDLLRTIALPALTFSLLFSLESYALGGPSTLHLAQLPWTLWFLMSLFCWRLLLPLVAQLRHPLLVTTAVAAGLGYVEEFGLLFSASRTLVYLPLFWLGRRLGQGAGRSGWRAAGVCRSRSPVSPARPSRPGAGTATSPARGSRCGTRTRRTPRWAWRAPGSCAWRSSRRRRSWSCACCAWSRSAACP